MLQNNGLTEEHASSVLPYPFPFHLFLCHSICSHLTLTSISPSPLSSSCPLSWFCSLFLHILFFFPQWKQRTRDSTSESDGTLTGWSHCPLPRAHSCARALWRLPNQTHIHTEMVGIHPPTHMHAYIYKATEGPHMRTPPQSNSTCVCVCVVLYISHHISMLHLEYTAKARNAKEVKWWRTSCFLAQYQYQYSGSVDFSWVFYVCATEKPFGTNII